MYEAEAQQMGVVVMRPLTSGTFQRWMARIDPGDRAARRPAPGLALVRPLQPAGRRRDRRDALARTSRRQRRDRRRRGREDRPRRSAHPGRRGVADDWLGSPTWPPCVCSTVMLIMYSRPERLSKSRRLMVTVFGPASSGDPVGKRKEHGRLCSGWLPAVIPLGGLMSTVPESHETERSLGASSFATRGTSSPAPGEAPRRPGRSAPWRRRRTARSRRVALAAPSSPARSPRQSGCPSGAGPRAGAR